MRKNVDSLKGIKITIDKLYPADISNLAKAFKGRIEQVL